MNGDVRNGDLAKIVDEDEVVLIVEVWEGTNMAAGVRLGRHQFFPLHLLEKVE